MASIQKTSTILVNSSTSLVPQSPAQTCFDTDSEDDSSIEYPTRQTKPREKEHLPCWKDCPVEWRKIVRHGLPKLAEKAGLGEPRTALAGSTFVFVWNTNTETFVALPEAFESAVWLIAYVHSHE
jgi:hypothetical protein